MLKDLKLLRWVFTFQLSLCCFVEEMKHIVFWESVTFCDLFCCLVFGWLNLLFLEHKDQSKRHHPLDLNTLKGHGDVVTGLSFSPDGRNLATGI